MGEEVAINSKERKLLNTLVSRLPAKFESLFQLSRLPDIRRGACTTYSRILAEVLTEFGVKAEVRPVYVKTANRLALKYINREISKEEAISRGGKIQVWGDIKEGQSHQHAVCHISAWDVVIDLSMAPRFSGLVDSYPYWAVNGKLPWWISNFNFRFYPLEYRWYETHPEEVKEAKDIVRELTSRFLEPSKEVPHG